MVPLAPIQFSRPNSFDLSILRTRTPLLDSEPQMGQSVADMFGSSMLKVYLGRPSARGCSRGDICEFSRPIL